MAATTDHGKIDRAFGSAAAPPALNRANTSAPFGATKMWRKLSKPWVILLASATIAAVAVLYFAYRLVDPLPPHRFAIAAGAVGSGYDNFARQYARILARHGVTLEIRNAA